MRERLYKRQQREQRMSSAKKVVIYGASGHTGQLVAAELTRKGLQPLLLGRNRAALERVAHELDAAVTIGVADVTDTDALHGLLEGADILVNCAGPHTDTSFPLALAAIDRGVHYLDTNAVEQLAAKRLFDDLSAAARHAGVVVVPGMATFGGLGDLLASQAARDLRQVSAITVVYAVQGWIPTRGSQRTAAMTQAAPRLTFSEGRFSVGMEATRIGTFDFGAPFGVLDVIENYPGVDVATIPRHASADKVAVHMTLSTLQEFRAFDPDLAARADAEARKKTAFAVVVEVCHGKGDRRMVVRGEDIYGYTATILGHAVERLARGTDRSGVLSPAQAFDAEEFMSALSAQGLRVQGASA